MVRQDCHGTHTVKKPAHAGFFGMMEIRSTRIDAGSGFLWGRTPIRVRYDGTGTDKKYVTFYLFRRLVCTLPDHAKYP